MTDPQSQAYVIVNTGFEYNDEIYSSHDTGGEPVKLYFDHAKAEAECERLNAEELRGIDLSQYAYGWSDLSSAGDPAREIRVILAKKAPAPQVAGIAAILGVPTPSSAEEDDEEERCPACGSAEDFDPEDGYCEQCDSFFDVEDDDDYPPTLPSNMTLEQAKAIWGVLDQMTPFFYVATVAIAEGKAA